MEDERKGKKVRHESGWIAEIVDGKGSVITVKCEDNPTQSGTYSEVVFKEIEQ